MRALTHISPAPAPDVQRAIELALERSARTVESSRTRNAWWHAGLAEQRAAGAASPLRHTAWPARGSTLGDACSPDTIPASS